jgi:hypothetical protein
MQQHPMDGSMKQQPHPAVLMLAKHLYRVCDAMKAKDASVSKNQASPIPTDQLSAKCARNEQESK